MKRARAFQFGVDRLCAAPRLLRGRRIGLVAHPASLCADGAHASVRLREVCGAGLVALFGPEHGFYGRAGAGEEIAHARHPAWRIPIHSLYGSHRRPTAAMLAEVDVVVFDLQDIAVRCYTFVTTLRYVMEACAAHGKTLVVCDRPVPLADVVDGPMPSPGFESFVAGVPMPFVYGMTPGESARFLAEALGLDLDLHVVRYSGARRGVVSAPWVSPSPGIRYWETAWTYPITVVTEALSSLNCGRGGTEPFQVLSASFLEAESFAATVNRMRLPGLRAAPAWPGGEPGIRLIVTDAARLRPFAAIVHILHEIQQQHGAERLWGAPGTRPEWFDKLMGTDAVRLALQRGEPAARILARTQAARGAFRRARTRALLY